MIKKKKNANVTRSTQSEDQRDAYMYVQVSSLYSIKQLRPHRRHGAHTNKLRTNVPIVTYAHLQYYLQKLIEYIIIDTSSDVAILYA